MKQCNLLMPKAVYSGGGSLDNLRTIMAGISRAAVFTDKGIRGAGLIDGIQRILEECHVEYTVFDNLPAEPSCDEAQAVIDEFRETDAGIIIGAGGGSVMDIAKLASIAAAGTDGVRALLENPSAGVKTFKTVMIPTTAGTGAEATPNSIVAVPEKKVKVGIVNYDMIPDYVILDSEMIKNLPLKIAASTGIDALAHAIECFTSKKATPFSDMFALQALELIMNHIEDACFDQNAAEARNNMMLAAFYAGVAITSSGTTAVHALSYPLGGQYHIPHGVANAMLLVPVMRFNEPACRPLLSRAYDRIAAGGSRQTEEEKSAWIIGELERIVRKLDIPVSLTEYGIGKEDLEILVESGMSVQRLLVNNRREVTREDARRLYLEIM